MPPLSHSLRKDPLIARPPPPYPQVNRLELTLSIGSFAAALGAMIAGIFGMNLRSTLENSVVGFWLTSAGIVLGCSMVFFLLFQFAKRKRIL